MIPALFLMACLAVGVIAGTQLVLTGRSENSIIGLNVALICAVTGLALLQEYYGLGFSSDIAFVLILPGAVGSIMYAKMLRGGLFK
ncbi:MAG: monovalent cation/H+ antiporter complex subunit F [Candidatus Altiarchaeota archaeon]